MLFTVGCVGVKNRSWGKKGNELSMSRNTTVQPELESRKSSQSFVDTRRYPRDARLRALDDYMNERAMSSERRDITSPLSADNPNVNIGELLVGDRCNLHFLKSSGYEISCANTPRSDSRADVIMVVMIRKGRVEVNNWLGRQRLGPGDIFFHATTDFKNIHSDSEIVRLYFPSGHLLARSRQPGEFFVVREHEPVSQVLKAAMSSLETSLREGSPTSKLVNRVTVELACKVFEDHIDHSAISGLDIIRARALEYIHDNISNPDLDTQQIVAYSAASRATLYRAFESLGGIKAYITFLRVEMARARIGAGILSWGDVSRIACACGFSSPDQLSSAFKTHLGVSPTNYSVDAPE